MKLQVLMFIRYSLTRRWPLMFVLICNVVGSVYGYMWYWNQLRATPWYFWPVVPDSPLSSTLFTLVLGFWIWRREVNSWLAMLAFVCCLKYGIWCVVVLGGYGLRDGGVSADNWMLICSHAAMALEVVVYFSLFRFKPEQLWLGGFWLLLNDLIDYGFNVHPYLEDNRLLAEVTIFTVFWTVCTLLIAARMAGVRYFFKEEKPSPQTS